jgi:hypothetical protein
MVQAATYSLYLYAVFFEVFDFCWCEMWFYVTMPESAYLLAIHPVEHTLLSRIAPGPYAAVLSERKSVIVAQSNVNYLEAQLRELRNHFRRIKLDVFFVAVPENAPVAVTERIEHSVFRYGRSMPRTYSEGMHI